MTLTIIGASKELRAFPVAVTVMVSVAKVIVGKVAETAKANKLNRKGINCGRDITILHEENKNAGCLGKNRGGWRKVKSITIQIDNIHLVS